MKPVFWGTEQHTGGVEWYETHDRWYFNSINAGRPCICIRAQPVFQYLRTLLTSLWFVYTLLTHRALPHLEWQESAVRVMFFDLSSSFISAYWERSWSSQTVSALAPFLLTLCTDFCCHSCSFQHHSFPDVSSTVGWSSDDGEEEDWWSSVLQQQSVITQQQQDWEQDVDSKWNRRSPSPVIQEEEVEG